MDSDPEILLQLMAQLDLMSLTAIIFFIVLLFCSALISGTEVAFFSLSKTDIIKISDESKEVLNAYGVWGPKKFMGKEYDGINRTTFVIDKDGIIKDIITKVKTLFTVIKESVEVFAEIVCTISVD